MAHTDKRKKMNRNQQSAFERLVSRAAEAGLLGTRRRVVEEVKKKKRKKPKNG